MLSLATSRSKKPSAQPRDPSIRLDFGETAVRRSFCFPSGYSQMSASGPKRKWVGAPHRSAFRCKADMTFSGGPLSRSLYGAKQT